MPKKATPKKKVPTTEQIDKAAKAVLKTGGHTSESSCRDYNPLREDTWQKLKNRRHANDAGRKIFNRKFRDLLLVLYGDLSPNAAIQELDLKMTFWFNKNGEVPEFE